MLANVDMESFPRRHGTIFFVEPRSSQLPEADLFIFAEQETESKLSNTVENRLTNTAIRIGLPVGRKHESHGGFYDRLSSTAIRIGLPALCGTCSLVSCCINNLSQKH